MTKIIIDIFMYIFEFLLVLYYADSLFEPKVKRATRIASFFFVTAVLGVIYQFNITYLNVILMLVSYVMLFLLQYKVSIKTAVFHSAVFLAVMFASELLTGAISSVLFKDFNALENDITAYIFVVFVSKLMYFAVMIAILKIFAQRENKENNSKYYWMLFVMPLSSVLMLLSFRYITYSFALEAKASVIWIISFVVVLFANILVFIIYEQSLKNTKELYELKAINQKQETDKTYMAILEKQNKDLRTYAHDTKNHLNAIHSLNSNPEIDEYLDKMIDELKTYSSVCHSGNHMLDVIINKYVTECSLKNIAFTFDVHLANLSYIDNTDLVTILGNALDNALEAAEQSKGKAISIATDHINTYDVITITNSCDEAPKAKGTELYTTKSNTEFHGLGVKSIKKIIKEYNGDFEWSYDTELNEFTLIISLLNK